MALKGKTWVRPLIVWLCLQPKVERLLSSEQKATDYRSPDDGAAPDHRPTNACIRIVAYLSRVLEVAFSALEGLNKQSFLTELGNRLHKGLLNHWQKFTFSPSGGLRLKRDITEYGEFVRSFNAPSIDEKFELLGIMANVFIVAPESLVSLFEGSPSIRKDALRFIQLRDDYKTAKIASMLNTPPAISAWDRVVSAHDQLLRATTRSGSPPTSPRLPINRSSGSAHSSGGSSGLSGSAHNSGGSSGSAHSSDSSSGLSGSSHGLSGSTHCYDSSSGLSRRAHNSSSSPGLSGSSSGLFGSSSGLSCRAHSSNSSHSLFGS
ncbi:hypothetical protein ACQ4PT_049565 [Festuca glaucescens]